MRLGNCLHRGPHPGSHRAVRWPHIGGGHGPEVGHGGPGVHLVCDLLLALLALLRGGHDIGLILAPDSDAATATSMI